jgi:hypothetical protein
MTLARQPVRHNSGTSFAPHQNYIHTAKVVTPIHTSTGGFAFRVDDQYDITFSKSSDVVRQLELGIDPELLAQPYVDGKFHIVDDQIIDYRRSGYTGFLHTPDSLKELSRRIGFTKDGFGSISAKNSTSRFEHNAFDSAGGQFDVDIGFQWSAFSPNLESHFEMVRQLCSNGHVFGQGTVMSRSVPIISGWESNMEVANHVLKRVFETTVTSRLEHMPSERIALSDVRVLGHQVDAILASDRTQVLARKFVESLKAKLSPILAQPGVSSLSTGDLKRIASPISTFDAFNIATELTSHYMAEDLSKSKLQAFSNSCIFDHKRQLNIESTGSEMMSDTFQDADRAFFAETCH